MHCNIYNVSYSQCYHQLASASIPAVFRVILLQECERTKLVKCVTTPTKFGVCILVTKKEHHPEDGWIASRIMLVRTLFIKYIIRIEVHLLVIYIFWIWLMHGNWNIVEYQNYIYEFHYIVNELAQSLRVLCRKQGFHGTQFVYHSDNVTDDF